MRAAGNTAANPEMPIWGHGSDSLGAPPSPRPLHPPRTSLLCPACCSLYPARRSPASGSAAPPGLPAGRPLCPHWHLTLGAAACSDLSDRGSGGLPVQFLLRLLEGQGGLMQGLQPPGLLPTPPAWALAAWEDRPPVAGPGTRGHGRGEEGRPEEDLGCWGASVQSWDVPSWRPCHAPQEHSGQS